MKLISLGTFAVIFLTYSPLSHAQKTTCTAKNRLPMEQCYSKPYEPVCAYYTKNCPFSVCGMQKSSPCEACSDPTFTYYEPGNCPASVQVSGCSSEVCNPDNDYFNFENKNFYQPVCAIKKKCTGKTASCENTISNVCAACNGNTYPFYSQGPCESDKKYCSKTRTTNCSATVSNVCASFKDSDNIEHFVTVSNSCNACKDKAVNYYLPGACGKPAQNETYCLPNSRPQGCTREYNPVCGFYKTANGGIDHKVMSNACTACGDSSVLYHTPGPCVFYCNRNPFLAIDCAGILEPVCGSYTENGVVKKVSFRNGCLGCYYNRYNIESYTEGLCPGDNGILCANNGGAFAEGQFAPVCALTTLNCNSASCRKTIADPLTACQGSTYVKYIPGYCPGDKGVSCAGYRTRPKDDQFQFTYANVCGYRTQTCTSSSCRSNYADQFAACANSNVLFFTAGPC